jgi:hypothetical protein
MTVASRLYQFLDSQFTDPPSPHSPRFARYLDPNNPAHVLYVLDRFKRFRDTKSKHELPVEFRQFGNTDYAQEEQKSWDDFKALQELVSQYPGLFEVHTFDTYAPSFAHVIWIFVGHYPLHSIRGRPMRLDGEFNFLEPSLRAFLDVWIRILAANGFNYGVAKCLMYSSVLIVDVLPVSGTSSFGEGCHLYKSLWKETRPLVTSMFRKLVNDCCVNAIGCVTMGVHATDAIKDLVKGLDIRVLNEGHCHSCLVAKGWCNITQQEQWLTQVTCALSEVSGDRAITVNHLSVEAKGDIVHVSPSFLEKDRLSKLSPDQLRLEQDTMKELCETLASKCGLSHWKLLSKETAALYKEMNPLKHAEEEAEEQLANARAEVERLEKRAAAKLAKEAEFLLAQANADRKRNVMLEVDMNRKRAVTKLDKESAKKLKEKEKKAKKNEEIIISNVTITMNRMLSEVENRSKSMINTTT